MKYTFGLKNFHFLMLVGGHLKLMRFSVLWWSFVAEMKLQRWIY